MPSKEATTSEPAAPSGLNHIVLNVRNLEESHQFSTEVVGLRKVGEFKSAPARPTPRKLRFYRGAGRDGTHHGRWRGFGAQALSEPPSSVARMGAVRRAAGGVLKRFPPPWTL